MKKNPEETHQAGRELTFYICSICFKLYTVYNCRKNIVHITPLVFIKKYNHTLQCHQNKDGFLFRVWFLSRFLLHQGVPTLAPSHLASSLGIEMDFWISIKLVRDDSCCYSAAVNLNATFSELPTNSIVYSSHFFGYIGPA